MSKWRDVIIASVIEHSIEAVVGVLWTRTNARLAEADAHRSGDAQREFNERFGAALEKGKSNE